MLLSVTHNTDVAAGSVEYREGDGSRCAVSTGVLPASGRRFSTVQPGVFPRTECPFRQRPGCELQLVKADFL